MDNRIKNYKAQLGTQSSFLFGQNTLQVAGLGLLMLIHRSAQTYFKGGDMKQSDIFELLVTGMIAGHKTLGLDTKELETISSVRLAEIIAKEEGVGAGDEKN